MHYPTITTYPLYVARTKVFRHQQIMQNGEPAQLFGINAWWLSDNGGTHQEYAEKQYANLETVVSQLSKIGITDVRLRLRALHQDLPVDEYLKRLVVIRDTLQRYGIRLLVCWWDSLYMKGSWANDYRLCFPMMAQVLAALGPDDTTYYEPFNEPNGWGAWDSQTQFEAWLEAYRETYAFFREHNYTGLLVADTPQWSSLYSARYLGLLEEFDESLPGMSGPNCCFAFHAYPPALNAPWSAERWKKGVGGGQKQHAYIVSEIGNQNGGRISPAWTEGAFSFYAKLLQKGQCAGVFPFLLSWCDNNSLYIMDNHGALFPTRYGQLVDGKLYILSSRRFTHHTE